MGFILYILLVYIYYIYIYYIIIYIIYIGVSFKTPVISHERPSKRESPQLWVLQEASPVF